MRAVTKRPIPFFIALVLSNVLMAALAIAADGKFNFRATSGYVTDGAGETYVLGETSSQTRNGWTFQWNTCGDCARDRSTSVAKFAGVNKRSNDGTQNTWTLTLQSTGTKTIKAAFGDATNSGSPTYAYFYDDTTLIASVAITPNATSANEYLDATGVLRTAANWDANNVAITHTFATTTFKLVIGSPSAQTGETRISHLQVLDGAAASGNNLRLYAIGENQ